MHPMGNQEPRIAAAVLAAGAGSRMGGPKADLVVEGSRLLDRAVAAVTEAGCAPVYAVVRADVPVTRPVVAVVNPEPDDGMRSSLVLAVEAAGDADALAVVLVDMPGVPASAIRAVITRWSPGRVVVGRYRSGRGHPIVMAPALWRAAVELAGPDEGARTFLAARPDLVDDVLVDGDPTDVDTPDDLTRWRR